MLMTRQERIETLVTELGQLTLRELQIFMELFRETFGIVSTALRSDAPQDASGRPQRQE